MSCKDTGSFKKKRVYDAFFTHSSKHSYAGSVTVKLQHFFVFMFPNNKTVDNVEKRFFFFFLLKANNTISKTPSTSSHSPNGKFQLF